MSFNYNNALQSPDTRILPLARALSAEPTTDEFKPGVFSFLICTAPPKVCGDDKPPSPPARIRAEPTAPLLNLGEPLAVYRSQDFWLKVKTSPLIWVSLRNSFQSADLVWRSIRRIRARNLATHGLGACAIIEVEPVCAALSTDLGASLFWLRAQGTCASTLRSCSAW